MWVCTHPSRNFSTDYISALRGRWPLKFLHALQFYEGLLAHTTNRVRGLPKNVKGELLKLGLKFHIGAFMTLGLVLVTSRNFIRARGRGDQVDTNFTRGAPYKIWEGKKCPKFGAVFDDFRIWSRISLERIDISKIGKVLDQLHFIPYWTKKCWWTLCWTLKFLQTADIGQGSLAHTTNRVEDPPKILRANI